MGDTEPKRHNTLGRHLKCPPRYYLLNGTGAVLLIAAILAIGWAKSGSKTDRITHLVNYGVSVIGTISEITTTKAELTGSRSITFVKYAFRDATGAGHSGSFRHYASSPLDLKPGGTLAVIYDPKDPKNHAPQHYLASRIEPIRD